MILLPRARKLARASASAMVLGVALTGCGGDSSVNGGGAALTAPATSVPPSLPPDDRERLAECDRRAERATVSFEPDQKMTIGRGDQVLVTASTEASLDTATTEARPSTTIVAVRLRCEVQAELRGDAFEVTPEGFRTASFLDRPVIRWSWDVVPRQAGSQRLTLEVRSVAVIDGRRVEGAGGELFATTIRVAAVPESAWGRVSRWSGDLVDHPLIRGFGSLALVLGTLGALWRRLLKRAWPWDRGSGTSSSP